MPEVSVVMAVHNGSRDLPETLDSILGQLNCEFEVVVVDDGSTDATPAILDQRATSDTRLRVIHQQNAGLTHALIRGCAEASGSFIARQDVGDTSLAGRLSAQAGMLRRSPELAFVSCRYSLVGPGNEPLTDSAAPPASARNGLQNPNGEVLPSPHHGTVMFRKSAYQKAGGYRPAFYFAQDVDLWSRLIEHGDLAYAPDLLYRVKFDLDSITARHRAAQQQLRRLVIEASALRRSGQSEADVLRRAAEIRPGGKARPLRGRFDQEAAAAYFVGSCLAQQYDPRARAYFLEALRHNPLHLRSWYKLARLTLAARESGT